MNKWITIGLAIAISAFLGANAILLFSDKSVISKSFYVHDYERVAAGDFEEKLPKEALVAPQNVNTVYVKSEDTIQDWLVKEGDVVTAGQELATLNTSTADEQRSMWESEREALQRQATEINSTISTLESDRANAASSNGANENATDNVTEANEDQTVNVGVNVDVDVDVSQDGAFAQAVAEAQQKLADINQKLMVVDAQLAQEGAASIISPIEGIVSAIRDEGNRLAIEIYSQERIILTYATDEQWQEVQVNDRVRLQADGLGKSVEGVVTQISQVPASDSPFLTAYKSLDPKEHKNPLAYYEVRIQPNEAISNLPFGNNTNALVLVNEAKQASSMKTEWLFDRFDQNAVAQVISKEGYAVRTPVTIAFDWNAQSIISDGLAPGSVVVYEPKINDYRYAPAIFFPMPMDSPTWESVKAIGWKNYLKFLIL